MKRILKFLRAVFGGRSRALVGERLKLCLACPHVMLKDGFKDGGGLFCRKCGCGTSAMWPLAELHHKLGYKNLRCPIGKWGPAPGPGIHDIASGTRQATQNALRAAGMAVDEPHTLIRPMPHVSGPRPHSTMPPAGPVPAPQRFRVMSDEEVRAVFGAASAEAIGIPAPQTDHKQGASNG